MNVAEERVGDNQIGLLCGTFLPFAAFAAFGGSSVGYAQGAGLAKL